MSGVFLCLWYLVGRGHLTTQRKADMNEVEKVQELMKKEKDRDNAPPHGIPRPLIVNGCIVSPCTDCSTLWTDNYLTNPSADGNPMWDRCPECYATYDGYDRK